MIASGETQCFFWFDPNLGGSVSETIQVADQGSWAQIRLNRPQALNSFIPEMHEALRAALDQARRDGKRALVLTGAGRGFCAGQDLGDRDPAQRQGPPDLGQTVREFYAPLVRQIRALPFPVICAVNGVAAGAGASLALACDLVVAAKSAKFIQSFAKVGLIPDTGGSWHLPRLLGEARAKGLALLGDPISADQAAEWGLIWAAVPDEALEDQAHAFADRLAQGPTLGLGLTKQAIHAASAQSLDAQLEMEADLMRTCGRSQDYAEGVAAFLAKRPPQFKGC